MSKEPNPAKWTGHGAFERRDIGSGGVIWFLVGLAVVGVILTFVVNGFYHYLESRSEAQQAPVSPLVTNSAKDTRHLSADYKEYLKQNFPSPQLEVDERNQLDQIRVNEEETLATYGWVDQKAGVVRIPIERAMDLIAQRGLPTRTAESGRQNQINKSKGTK